MKKEYINPFLEATQELFNEVAQMKIEAVETVVKKNPVSTKNVVVMIGITGDLKGTIAVNLDESLAMHIASNMMCGMEVSELNELSMSAVKELFNMTMGRVATRFSEQGINIDITPPNMMIGKNMILSVAFLPLLSIKFKYNQYNIDFDISVKEQ